MQGPNRGDAWLRPRLPCASPAAPWRAKPGPIHSTPLIRPLFRFPAQSLARRLVLLSVRWLPSALTCAAPSLRRGPFALPSAFRGTVRAFQTGSCSVLMIWSPASHEPNSRSPPAAATPRIRGSWAPRQTPWKRLQRAEVPVLAHLPTVAPGLPWQVPQWAHRRPVASFLRHDGTRQSENPGANSSCETVSRVTIPAWTRARADTLDCRLATAYLLGLLSSTGPRLVQLLLLLAKRKLTLRAAWLQVRPVSTLLCCTCQCIVPRSQAPCVERCRLIGFPLFALPSLVARPCCNCLSEHWLCNLAPCVDLVIDISDWPSTSVLHSSLRLPPSAC